ncbi:hypothetical protein ACQBAR_07265 [Propionibacteriaceae bacterium Y1685]
MSDQTAADLISGIRDLAAATTDDRIDRPERIARAGKAARQAADVAAIVPHLDPYADGVHSRSADMLTLAGKMTRGRDRDAAAERISMHQQHAELAAQVRAWATLDGLHHPTSVAPTAGPQQSAAWLNTYAQPTTAALGPAATIPTLSDNLPEATIDPSPSNPVVSNGELTGDGDPLTWRTAAYGVNESLQVLDWADGGANELDQLITMIVDVGLERQLLADLTAGLTPAADLDAAEAAAGTAWGGGADVIVVHATDAGRVYGHYGAAGRHTGERPTIVTTAGATPGTAVVLAMPAIRLEAAPLEWLIQDRPRELGRDAVAIRYGRARARIAGAVQTVGL